MKGKAKLSGCLSLSVFLSPEFIVFINDLEGIIFVLGLSVESKSVGGLSIGNLVVTEPVVDLFDEARTNLSQIINVYFE